MVLIVTCQVCGDCKVLAGAPDGDGWARAYWNCPCCGSGQVVQLEVSADARDDLRGIVLGMKMTRVEHALAEWAEGAEGN
jgi:hypothetical protein